MAMKLLLLHGRTDPDQDMDGLVGFPGAVLDGVTFTHWTYGTTVVHFMDKAATDRALSLTGWEPFGETALRMTMHDDMVKAGAAYFGDFEMQPDIYPASRMDQAQCSDCEAILDVSDLGEIKGIEQRVAPSEDMPAGECPHCGALCHLI